MAVVCVKIAMMIIKGVCVRDSHQYQQFARKL